MSNALRGGIYVVAATFDGKTEYWAAATIRENALAAVWRELPPGWNVTLTDWQLTPQKIKALKLRPNAVCLLREAK
jgi:GTPase Era involved in 16S rRNA processing